jgi:hypothetical protein
LLSLPWTLNPPVSAYQVAGINRHTSVHPAPALTWMGACITSKSSEELQDAIRRPHLIATHLKSLFCEEITCSYGKQVETGSMPNSSLPRV